ncbi:uncharacterized protein LOC132720110 isoform X2 [Ruditapes philippinarum]|uniref:uncharacterized protein LOC132720110 isoform X2 n=1 Tax=Ruditapes philippinarum TaxID=129788 RepID=UPI00295BAB8A|nr:uncharacterized protein LOC132720110 isoform X2 [Ruditapes philippinarum]
MSDFLMDVEIRKASGRNDKLNGDITRTSSFQDRIDQNGSSTPAEREIENILREHARGSPRRRNQHSPLKSYSPTRSTSQSPRRERSFLRSTSPDKLPFRKSAIWAQWGQSKNDGQDYLQEYNVKQMTSLYGKDLRGKVDAASDWYRVNGLDRSKTQTEALNWLSQEMKTREMLKEEKNINKLSHRNRIQRTPSIQDIRARETKFTNDAIVTEKRRTRFKDIIPQYDASSDRHCKAYFKRKDVQQLLNVTRSADTTPAGSVTPGVTPSIRTPRQTPGATPF